MATQCLELGCTELNHAKGRCARHYAQRRYHEVSSPSEKHLHQLSAVDPDTRTGVCRTCGLVKVWSAQRRNGEERWICSIAHARRTRKTRLKEYGISPEQFAEMVSAQGGACAGGCGRPCTHVDHDHQTGRVRGLLCHRCNVAIGMAEENSERLLALADYILSHLREVPP